MNTIQAKNEQLKKHFGERFYFRISNGVCYFANYYIDKDGDECCVEFNVFDEDDINVLIQNIEKQIY